MEDYNKIYPQLPQNEDPSNFRLQKSCENLHDLENEMKHYEKVRKKYNRVRGIFSKISVVSGGFSAALSAGALGTTLTGVGAVVGIPLGVVAGVCGGISVGCGLAAKRLSHNVSKHEQTVSLAKAKVNTVNGLVSKALKDNKISDPEFSLILAETEKFEQLKSEIRQKAQKETEKKLDLSQIRTEVRAEILKELTTPAH